MEKRIGAAIIVIQDKASAQEVNAVLSSHSEIIIGRQGIPMKDRALNVISLVLEGTTNQLSSLTGQLGRVKGIQVKSVLTKNVCLQDEQFNNVEGSGD